MTQLTKPIRDVRAQAQQAVRDAAARAGGSIGVLARAGYVAKGVVYVLVGGLALLAATGYGGRTTGSRGALRTLLDHRYGLAALAVIAIGLAAYAAWCFLRALLDFDHKGRDARGVARRAVIFCKGVVYGALVVAVADMMRGGGGGAGGDAGVRDWTARLMSFPLGVWLVGLSGAAVVVFGLRQLYCARAADVDEPLDFGTMSPAARRWATRLSRFGLAARGVVFAIVGGFLVVAARHENPAEARGIGGSLHALGEHAFGWVLLAVVALGLMAYGCYQMALARYRRIRRS